MNSDEQRKPLRLPPLPSQAPPHLGPSNNTSPSVSSTGCAQRCVPADAAADVWQLFHQVGSDSRGKSSVAAAKGGSTESRPDCSRQKRRGLSVKQRQHTCRRTNSHAHTHTHTHTHTQTRMCIHTCAYTNSHARTHTHAYTHIHTHTLVRTTRTHMHTHTHKKRETKTHMHTHKRACARIHTLVQALAGLNSHRGWCGEG